MLKVIITKITAFMLVFILFAHNINTLVIIGDFIVNQDFIAKTLCIQKEAQNGCNGKCQLRKELSENNANTTLPESPLQENKRLVLDAFCLFTINKAATYGFKNSIQLHSFFKTPIISKLYLEIDTPPPNFS